MKSYKEPIFATIALGLTVTLLFTRDVDMSATLQNTLLSFFTLTVLVFATFIYREKPADEREYELSMVASKYAYLIGSAVISIGIVVQTLDHNLDPWLTIALASMVITKIVTHFIRK